MFEVMLDLCPHSVPLSPVFSEVMIEVCLEGLCPRHARDQKVADQGVLVALQSLLQKFENFIEHQQS